VTSRKLPPVAQIPGRVLYTPTGSDNIVTTTSGVSIIVTGARGRRVWQLYLQEIVCERNRMRVSLLCAAASLFLWAQGSLSGALSTFWPATVLFLRSQCLRGLRRGSAAARFLGLRARIPPGAWVSVSSECYVLSDRGLCVGLITCPEESYRLWCVWVWSWSLDNEEALPHWGLLRHGKKWAVFTIVTGEITHTAVTFTATRQSALFVSCRIVSCRAVSSRPRTSAVLTELLGFP
jgi:hypothetical protein